jgi:hypothetical protein
MRGLTLRVTNNSSTAQSFPDLPTQPILAIGESRELLYSDDVQASLEYGSLNALILAGKVTVQFVNGTNLSQAAIGRTFTGATPTAAGAPGLVPTAQPASRTAYLKGDGTWEGVTPAAIGAIPQSVLTAQGDTLYRGVTTAERLPLGTLGQVYRAGVVHPEWLDAAKSGLLSARPLPGPTLAGVLYWATDQPSGSQLSICYFNGGGYGWLNLGTGGGGGGGNTNTVVIEFDTTTTSPLVVGTVTAGQYLDRAVIVTGTAWNGSAPTVEFGTATSPSLLLTPLEVDLTSPGQYESGEVHKFLVGDDLVLTITSSGSTVGTGTLLFTLVG